MKRILLYLAISFPVIVYSQKIKHDDKTNRITVDGVFSFKVERINCGFGEVDCHYDVYDTSGNKVIVVNLKYFSSAAERKPSNPDGRVTYHQFVFLAAKTKAEMVYLGLKEERIAKVIVDNKLIVNGKLDDKAVEEFVLVKGTPYSERARL